MLSNIFSDPFTLGFIVLAIAALVLLGLVIWMYIKMRKFLIGIDAKNISDSLSFVSSGLKELQTFRTELERYLTEVETRLRKSARSIHTVRFNPFKGTGDGGNQSFATAILTEEGDGVIISSLYSRDHVSVFAKPIKGYSTEHELSEEEREALDRAKDNLK